MSFCSSKCLASRLHMFTSTMNPREVCALHRKNRYDLILLDLQMPGMDGFQVMEALKTNELEAYLPVLVITAQPGHKLRALQAGARDFISKPFDLVEVQTRIRNMLEVRLLYKKLANYNAGAGTDGAGTNRRTARKRSALSQPDRTGLRLVLGAGREHEFHQGLGSGPGDARHPGRPAGWANRWVLRTQAGMSRSAPSCRRPLPPGNRSLIFSSTALNADGSRQQFRVSGEPMFNRSCRFIGYRGIGVEVTSKN
jgi:CheY-like chemotaxis protein